MVVYSELSNNHQLNIMNISISFLNKPMVGVILILLLTWIAISNKWLKLSGLFGLLIISTSLYFFGNIAWFVVFFFFSADVGLFGFAEEAFFRFWLAASLPRSQTEEDKRTDREE